MRGIRRGLRRWLWLLPVALPAALLLIANLWLASPFGRGWIAGKIQSRTRLETRVGGASVTPWSGIVARDLALLQPPPLRQAVTEPLARIRGIRLEPVWKSWIRGRAELESIELDSPRLVIPLELLADAARSRAPEKPQSPPSAVVTPPPAAPAAPPAATPPATPPAAAPPPQVPAAALPPTGWLRVKNASFILVSASSGKALIELSGIDGAVPVSGLPAESELRVRAIRAAGADVLSDVRAALDWRAPVLSLKPLETECRGVKLTLAAKLALASGLPLQLEARVPRQPFPPLPLPGDGEARAASIAADASFRGILLAPGTWQGDLVTEALAPSVRLGGHEAKFDRGGTVTVLRGGMLSCVDARLIGDELSFLGNATLLADGRLAGVLRMVAPPESAAAIARRVFPGIGEPSLTPLSTPQRAAFDLEAFGNIGQISLRPGRDAPVMELKR